MATKTRNNLPSPEASADVTTFIGAGTRVVGRISGQEDVRVHGTIEGHVRLAQTLYIEAEGVALAEIFAHDVVVSGTVVGNIHAESAVVLTASARVVGDIRSPRVSVEPGAAFRGSISMEAVDADQLEAEANASRNYAARASAPRGAISERTAATNGEARRTAPARQQQQAVRLPPRRAQAFTSAPQRAPSQDPRAWAPRGPHVMPRLPAPAAQRPTTAQEPVKPAPAKAVAPVAAVAPVEDEDTIIVQHPALRSDDRPRRRNEPAALPTAETGEEPRKAARPRTLPRGKHKVERVD